MIRFDGELTGNAKEYFIKKLTNRISIFLFLVLFLNIPIWSYMSFVTDTGYKSIPYIVVLVVISSCLFKMIVGKSKKIKEQVNIKKVIIKDDVVSMISEEISPKRAVKRVKKVCDYGDFYEIVFSPLDLLAVCVCQKNLISKGNIKEFEELFADKLIKQEVNKH